MSFVPRSHFIKDLQHPIKYYYSYQFSKPDQQVFFSSNKTALQFSEKNELALALKTFYLDAILVAFHRFLSFMSIYSGFATRFQEEAYDNCIDSLLYILQKRIIKFYQGDTADQEKFVSLVLKLHQQMRNMEKNKYLEPKSSLSVNELIKFLNNFPPPNTPAQPISNNKSKTSQPAQSIEQKPSLPEIAIQKKKSTFWVEKKPAELQSNKTQTQQEAQTMGTLNKNSSKGDKFEFKRTTYHPRNIRAFNVKNASRSKLSGEKHEERYLGMLDEKSPRARAMSNHIHAKNAIHYRQTNQQAQQSHRNIQKRKNRSVPRNNQAELTGTEGQVNDIIKDYIVKAKKNYLRGYRNRDSKQPPLIKPHDF